MLYINDEITFVLKTSYMNIPDIDRVLFAEFPDYVDSNNSKTVLERIKSFFIGRLRTSNAETCAGDRNRHN